MVACIAAIEVCYGRCTIALSTRVLQAENERSIGVLASIFCTKVAG